MIINVNIANKSFRWSYIWGDGWRVGWKDGWNDASNRVKIYNIIKFNNENSNFYSREKMCEFMGGDPNDWLDDLIYFSDTKKTLSIREIEYLKYNWMI